MYKIFSWYNQNRRWFWILVLAAIIIGMIAWRLINMASDNSKQTNYTQTPKIDTNNFNSIAISDQKSVLTRNSISSTEKELSVIDNFISYCNSGKTEEAYKLISDECKEEMYPNLKNFEELYYKPVFENGARNVSIENWTGDIYKVDLKEDALATGKINSENNLQDYITLTKDNEGNTKLNINGYIRRTAYDKTASNDSINIKLLRADTYMDYEIYTFQVENKTDKAVALGNVQDIDVSYLIDKNDLDYNAYNTELSQASITLSQRQTKTVQIKYLNRFSSTRQINAVVFPRLILDYDLFKTPGNSYPYTYPEIKIEL